MSTLYNKLICMDILNELYVGETEFIKEFIDTISKARAPYVGKMKRPIKGNKDFIKIGDMIAEEFGFYSVTFSVPFDTTMNAYTYPITMATDISMRNVKPKFFKDSGLKYDENSGRLCTLICVTAGVWFSSEFTDREVTALILHEIGHNFVTQSYTMIDMIEANRMAVLVNILYNLIMHMYTLNPIGAMNDISELINSTNFSKDIKIK